MGYKTCIKCGYGFNWMDVGSTKKFDKTNLCPDCENKQDEQAKTDKGEI